jgi:hypothetical protein
VVDFSRGQLAFRTSPICSIDPGTAPKAIDVIPPAGVDQSAELDPTRGPVALHGVVVP